jgi:transposase
VQLEERIAGLEQQLQHLFRHHEVCQRLAQVEGIGLLTATTMVAAVGDAELFRNGRELTAGWA